MADKFKGLMTQKKVIKCSLTRLKTKTNVDIDSLNLIELNVRRSRLIDISKEVKTIFSEILENCEEGEIEEYCEEKETLFDTCDALLVSLDTAILKFNEKSETTKERAGKAGGIEIKLPTLSLPTFSGSIDEWLTFSDLFQAAVTNNDKLADAQKLQYLKGVLGGEAQRIIQSLTITDSNFKIAWDLLKERYFHKREIVCSLMKKFLTNTSLGSESPTQILNLVDSTKEFVRSLEALDLKLDSTSKIFMMFIIQFKLDKDTKCWWERSLTSEEIPSLEEILQFLSSHARAQGSTEKERKYIPKRVTVASGFSSPGAVKEGFGVQCVCCHGNHTLGKCDVFLKFPVKKRVNLVRSKNICFNCLTQFHRKATCNSKNTCRKCHKSHHTLLHFENASESTAEPGGDSVGSNSLSVNAEVFVPSTSRSRNGGNSYSNSNGDKANPSITSCCSDFGSNNQVLLCTALVKVCDSYGGEQLCRALLDPGSQGSLITSQCLQRLGLSKRRTNVIISCLGASDTRTMGLSQIKFSSQYGLNSYVTSVYVVNKIVGQLPHSSLDSSYSLSFSDLQLADPTFYKSGPIDILLGVDISLPMLNGQKLSNGEGRPFAVRSELGWIIAGSVPSGEELSVVQVNNIQMVDDQLVSKFWQLDSVPTVSLLTKDEKACEAHFDETHSRAKDGRYIVRLPFHTPPSSLGDSRERALHRLQSVERSLTLNPERYNQYREFMREYLNLNHMELVPNCAGANEKAYYLPHHSVYRDSSTTTKLRVVFDASSKTSSGYSLNDLLMIGPRVQRELYPILLNFRTFQVAICADIEKMFRQIKIHPEDANWQRILWRESPKDPVREYKLVTVTYGTTCAPFLSTRSMKQLALDEKEKYPLASDATLNHFYVDDLLSGAATEEEAVELVSQLTKMMRKGGFVLRKWRTNAPAVLEEVLDERGRDLQIVESEDDIKVLGIKWNPRTDCFGFTVAPFKKRSTFSKREILSEVSRMFDPLGFISPCVVLMKIMLQDLWKHNLSWDQPISKELTKKWLTVFEEIHLLQQVKIPRCVLQSHSTEVELHGFCDASEKAYCAAVYVRCISSDSRVSLSLLTSKTRVAPLKTQSLPRLELCSALLLAEVLHAVLNEAPFTIRKTVAWADSTITLAWLSTEPYRWQSFVANRVSKIQTTIPTVSWCHVPGDENPADLGTRGLLPSQLIDCDHWFRGPSWLTQPISDLSKFQTSKPVPLSDNVLMEERKITVSVARLLSLPEFINDISSFSKLIRVRAWIQRFIHNAHLPSSKSAGCLTSGELYRAITSIVRLVQESEFSTEREILKKGKSLPHDSKLLPLNVFLDSDGLLRVGGRLSKHSSLSYDQMHPMLLPKGHEFMKKVIIYYHESHLHAGPQLTLSLIRQKFWVVNGRSVVQQELRKCIKCFRLNLRSSPQLMGDLPTARISQSRPFECTGIDFAGPLTTKCAHKRSITKLKSYICLFVCTATKAIHLELVSELSTAAFLAALRRFISRRNCPSKIMSDNGSNFRGASNHLKRLVELCRQSDVQDFCSLSGIEWSFIPPYTPHFGGLWESAIKSTKQLLTKISSSALLNFEEVNTLLIQIEACLNSRPLTELSPDPSELSALTPAHFLVGGPIKQFPEPVQPTKSTCLTERWSLLQRLRQHFWERWSREYLHRLQPRAKWWRSKPNLQVGDMVVVEREGVPPLEWTLGRIVNIQPGEDQRVRVVMVNTKQGHLTRAVNKVYLLPTHHTAATSTAQ